MLSSLLSRKILGPKKCLHTKFVLNFFLEFTKLMGNKEYPSLSVTALRWTFKQSLQGAQSATECSSTAEPNCPAADHFIYT